VSIFESSQYHKLLDEALKELKDSVQLTTSDPGFRELLQEREILTFMEKVERHFLEVRDMVEALYQVVLYYGLRQSGMEPSLETMLHMG